MSDSPTPLADPHLVYDPVAGDGPKDVVILGSTGSIGTQAIDLVLRNPDRFRVTGLSANGGRVALLAEQAHRLGARTVAVAREDVVPQLRETLSALYGAGEPLPEILAGPEAATQLAASDAHTVLNGITGSIGLAPTLAALEAGRTSRSPTRSRSSWAARWSRPSPSPGRSSPSTPSTRPSSRHWPPGHGPTYASSS